ncbi:MAG: hypothetical protein K2P81_09820 [Bacteriovoracaceae bacterium]|nr:hypothetical protein [Bacteriovoracaceae bacterium]
MRSTLALIAFISTSAFACPNLTGSYTVCRSTTGATEGSSDVVVTQSVVNGATVYSLTSTDDETQERSSDSVIADGQVRTISETDSQSGLVIVTSTQASCVGNALVLKTSSSIQGQEIANVNMTVSKSGNTLSQVVSGQAFGQPINDTVNCQ